MKRIIASLFIFFLFVQFISAQQPSKADLDKMMKQAQDQMKKYNGDTTLNNVMKNMQNQQKQITNAMTVSKNKDTTFSINKPDTAAYALPPRNTKLLNSLPIRTFNKAELVSYLHNLYAKMKRVFQNDDKINIDEFPEVSAVEDGDNAVGLWIYSMPEQAELMAVHSVEMDPDQPILLNNAGGILTCGGFAVYAIPILQYVLEKEPGNNMILNNLGQAYLSLGDHNRAEQYLLQCIASYKYYPDANLALAMIKYFQGNYPLALQYVENSLRGAWSSKADNLLHKLKPGARLMDYIKLRYKQPQYFDFDKYPMLPQCLSIGDIADLEPQYVGYHEMINQLIEKHEKNLADAVMAQQQSMLDKIRDANKTGQSPLRPFGVFANAVCADLRKDHKEKLKYYDSVRTDYYRERKLLNDAYEKKFQDIEDKFQKSEYPDQETRCRAINALSNEYLPSFANQTKAFQTNMLKNYKDYFNDMIYWSNIASINDDSYRVEYNKLVLELLGLLNEINTTRFMESKYDSHRFYPCKFTPREAKKEEEPELEEAVCELPQKVELNFGAFKAEASCESYKLEVGEGTIGKLEYDRVKGEFTLAAGPGYSTSRLFFEGLGAEAGIEGEIKSQFYITFDRNLRPCDLGILWEAELKGKLELGHGALKESIGHEEKMTAGFGSGLVINDESFIKKQIDEMYPVQPDDKQIDKKVKLYPKEVPKKDNP